MQTRSEPGPANLGRGKPREESRLPSLEVLENLKPLIIEIRGCLNYGTDVGWPVQLICAAEALENEYIKVFQARLWLDYVKIHSDLATIEGKQP